MTPEDIQLLFELVADCKAALGVLVALGEALVNAAAWFAGFTIGWVMTAEWREIFR